jgi:hypothetical protein
MKPLLGPRGAAISSGLEAKHIVSTLHRDASSHELECILGLNTRGLKARLADALPRCGMSYALARSSKGTQHNLSKMMSIDIWRHRDVGVGSDIYARSSLLQRMEQDSILEGVDGGTSHASNLTFELSGARAGV